MLTVFSIHITDEVTVGSLKHRYLLLSISLKMVKFENLYKFI